MRVLFSDRQLALLARWLNTTSLPIPMFIRAALLDMFVGSRKVRAKVTTANLELELDPADFWQAQIFLKNGPLPHRFMAAIGSVSRSSMAAKIFSVPSTDLDTHQAKNAIAAFDVVKIDIKGPEIQAINGMRQGLTQNTYRVLFIEMHPIVTTDFQQQQMLATLQEARYRIYDVYPDHLALTDTIHTSHCCAISPEFAREHNITSQRFELRPTMQLPFES